VIVSSSTRVHNRSPVEPSDSQYAFASSQLIALWHLPASHAVPALLQHTTALGFVLSVSLSWITPPVPHSLIAVWKFAGDCVVA